MHTFGNGLVYSATDLSDYLACDQLSLLERAAELGEASPPLLDDPSLEVLRAKGREHEQAYLEQIRAQGTQVWQVPAADPDSPTLERWQREAGATLEAMSRGSEAIYQATLFDGVWIGRPDFLKRVEQPSDLGAWSYEIVDTKLAREAKAGALLQIALYSHLLAQAQGTEPEHMSLALGGPDRPEDQFRYADFAAYFRLVREQFLDAMEGTGEELSVAPEPCEHCQICSWRPRCDRERHEVDHLSLVAGITSRQRKVLEEERKVMTMEQLAELFLPLELEGVSPAAAERIREQARLQVQARRDGEFYYEFLTPVVEEEGLAALPKPSPGDLFFDFEGDPYFEDEGLEYLFGWVDVDGKYEARWALDRRAEKKVFESFMDFVMMRWEEHPDLHIYHYHTYETSAFKRLAGRHGTREDELDRLLRGGVFVNLHRVVRQGLRASVERYSIKELEPLYGYDRDVDLRTASVAMSHFQAWLALGHTESDEQGLLAELEGYNRDDCLSTRSLREWLEALREEVKELTGHAVPRSEPGDPEPSDDAADVQEYVAGLIEGLTDDVPVDLHEATGSQAARWLLAQVLGWHRREKKSAWWQYFAWLELNDQELVEDRSTLGGLSYEGVVDEVKRSYVHRYRFPRQEHDLKAGDRPRDPKTESGAGKVTEVDDSTGTIHLKRSKTSDASHPTALIPVDMVWDGVLRESIQRTAEVTLDCGLAANHPHRAITDLLLRNAPRIGQEAGMPLAREEENALDAAVRIVQELDHSVLPIQGPPGAGKTYTGARMILELLRGGYRVGITATSHKVISNLLDETCKAAEEAGFAIAGLQKASESQRCDSSEIRRAGNSRIANDLATGEHRLAAGTAWLWSREEMTDAVDYLFVDEAGQFSLANAVAVAPATANLVLLGDPRQLEQPTRGVHPPGADVSVLEHLLEGEPTVSRHRGIFLAESWRLPPEVSRFTSEVFYRGRLRSRPELEVQSLETGGPIEGAGLRFIPVEHDGNRSESPEEAQVVATLVEALLDTSPEWQHRDGTTRTLALEDILVVAPYNAQVTLLLEALPDGARVGTVDKFQGQEGAVAIYSMTTSSPEDAPRGMSFLYSPNRMNVATSRTQCLAVLVGSPALFRPECKSPPQMRLANAVCRFREMAEVVSFHNTSR